MLATGSLQQHYYYSLHTTSTILIFSLYGRHKNYNRQPAGIASYMQAAFMKYLASYSPCHAARFLLYIEMLYN